MRTALTPCGQYVGIVNVALSTVGRCVEHVRAMRGHGVGQCTGTILVPAKTVTKAPCCCTFIAHLVPTRWFSAHIVPTSRNMWGWSVDTCPRSKSTQPRFGNTPPRSSVDSRLRNGAHPPHSASVAVERGGRVVWAKRGCGVGAADSAGTAAHRGHCGQCVGNAWAMLGDVQGKGYAVMYARVHLGQCAGIVWALRGHGVDTAHALRGRR